MPLTNAGAARVIRTGSLKSGCTHIALFTANPTVTGSLANEMTSTAGYSRKAITWTTLTGNYEQNSNLIDFIASGSWPTITHWGLVSNGTRGSGTMYAFGPLTSSRTLTAGARIRYSASTIRIEASTS